MVRMADGTIRELRSWKPVRLFEGSAGRKSFVVLCPYCGRRQVLYVWSVAGHGKRCEGGCGAMFRNSGTATKDKPGAAK
jgi:hypothetical protein